jgi:hypothetical protein
VSFLVLAARRQSTSKKGPRSKLLPRRHWQRILAYRACSTDADSLQATAGLLLITGFACLGVAVYLIGGSRFW